VELEVGSSALAGFGIMPHPMGTLEELRQQGLDPARIGSCAPNPDVSGDRSVRGCPMWSECPFHLKRYGGFKANGGPHYIAYFMQSHDNRKKEDIATCYAYTLTLLKRERAARAAREDGKPHEIIRVVAQEGGEYWKRDRVPVDPKDQSITAKYKWEEGLAKVPRFPRPMQNEDLYNDQALTQRELKRMTQDPDFEIRLDPAVPAAEPEGEDVLDMPTAAPESPHPVRSKRT